MAGNTSFSQNRLSAPGTASIVAIGLALAFCLVILRIYMLSDYRSDGNLLVAAGKWAAASYQDLAFSTLLTSIFLLIDWLVPTRRKAVAVVFFVVALVVVLWGTINIEVVKMLGEPFTLAWLYYSDFLKGREAINGIMFALTLHNLLLVFLVIAVFTLSVFLLISILRRMVAWRLLEPFAPILALAVTVSLIPLFTAPSDKEDAKVLNPAIAFIRSMLQSGSPEIPGMTKKIANITSIGHTSATQPQLRTDRQGVTNVIFFVLESTPAEYLQSYGGKYDVTPNLSSYASKAYQFENIYAHVPATNQSLFSMITSLYPQVGSRGMTLQLSGVDLISISNILSEKGYRTGLFDSADTRFQSSDAFLRNKGFDVVEDHRTRSCDTAVFHNSSEDWPFMDFSHDRCTIESLTKWIDADPGKPFFGLFWAGMTHYPYFSDGPEKKYTSQISLNRYLNALRTVDDAFGLLMRNLKQRNLDKSTLVVVLGDHGEAFGRHGVSLHANAVYEENVHIPLLLINETLFSGGQSTVLGGITDISPTVLEILGLPAPSTWQGRSLFATTRPQRVFFFASFKGFPVGYREGSRKFIYYAGRNEMEIFDLSTDPNEKQNLAPQDTKATDEAKAIIASWIQQQNDYIYRLVNAPQTNEPDTNQKGGSVPVKVTVFASGTKFLSPPKVQLLVDGANMGSFEVKSAPSNADRYPSEEEIEAAVEPFVFTLSLSTCPRKVEIKFLNDEWAGEGLSGDTNLMIKSIQVNSVTFPKERMHIDGPIGDIKNGNMWIWQEGKLGVDLGSAAICD